MAVIQSFGTLQRYSESPRSVAVESTHRGLEYASCDTYAAIYRTQPHVRTVVDFLARNVAQVPFHVYRRVSDTDRVRLIDHELAKWLGHPNPGVTNYTLIENTVQDLGIYGMAYWLKVREADRIGLVRLAPDTLIPQGWVLPTGYLWTKPDGSRVSLRTIDVVSFRYFNPDDPLIGLSPLETLRQILAQDAAAVSYRRNYWANAARLEGVIERADSARAYTPEQALAWREQWRAQYTGQPGQIAMLPPGDKFKEISHSARESEFNAGRKLTREEVAAAYHVPLPFVGILDHATFSNIREQHKNLYQDCLGPTFEMMQQEIERQLLIECHDRTSIYVEANIAEKLKGSFEEQAAALRNGVGVPWMTTNEGRARMNLPSIKDPSADRLAMPLNMAGAADEEVDALAAGRVLPFSPTSLAPRLAPAIRATWDRQRARLEKIAPGERAQAFVSGRWDRELAADLEACYRQAGLSQVVAAQAGATLAATINAETLQLLVQREDAFSDAREAALYV